MNSFLLRDVHHVSGNSDIFGDNGEVALHFLCAAHLVRDAFPEVSQGINKHTECDLQN